MKSKKIICTVTTDLTYDQRMIRICTSLTDSGYEVLLVGRTKKDSVPLEIKVFEQKRIQCFFHTGKLFYLEYNIRLFLFLIITQFDIVCSIDLDTILPGYLTSRFKNKVCVYDAHEYFTELPEVVRRPFIKKAWSLVAKFTIPNLKYCYTVGHSLATIFDKEYGVHFEVIRNVPFNSSRYSEKPKVGKNLESGNSIILYQGVLNEGRGLEQVIEAMKSIDKAELWLAGEGDLSKQLKQLVGQQNLEKKVKFLGYLKPNQLKEITAKASIGLNLLENRGLNYYYSLANKAFDYIQSEIPSISMRFPEYQSINREYEVFCLIDSLDEATIIQALNKLLLNNSYYDLLRENCRKAKEIYNWEIEETKLIQFYSKIPNRIS